jgi:hypothetical protein
MNLLKAKMKQQVFDLLLISLIFRKLTIFVWENPTKYYLFKFKSFVQLCFIFKIMDFLSFFSKFILHFIMMFQLILNIILELFKDFFSFH